MQTFYFGDTDKPLLGVYHPPAAAEDRRAAVLLCYPLGHEYVRCHRTFRRFADTLARAGYHVLRFDYRGTGDSGGAFADSDAGQWQEDIHTAADELLAMSAATEINLVGLRLGASLAAHAVADGLDVAHLVLWDPVLSGADFLEGLADMHAARARSILTRATEDCHMSEECPDQLCGFVYPSNMRESLCALSVPGLSPAAVKRVSIVAPDLCPELAGLRDRLGADRTAFHPWKEGAACGWDRWEDMNELLLPGVIPATITNILVRGAT